MIRVLAVGPFDPAGVVIGHADALHAQPNPAVRIDVALDTAYAEVHEGARWCASTSRFLGSELARVAAPSVEAQREELRAAIDVADVIQIHPGIGQPWGDALGTAPRWRTHDDDGHGNAFGLDWPKLLAEHTRRGKPVVAFFHGSVHTRANASAYMRDTVERGFVRATSTIDYATDLCAAYLPPTLADRPERAPHRGEHDPLVVAHTPTNPGIASTLDFRAAARKLGLPVHYVYRREHAASLDAKARAHATFDHLRGCFSVNALEAARVGSIPIFFLPDALAEALDARGFDAPPARVFESTATSLERTLRTLRDDRLLCGDLQAWARLWWLRNFSQRPDSRAVAALVDFYRSIV